MNDEEIIEKLNKWLKEICNAYETHLANGGRKDTDYEEYIDLLNSTLDLIYRQQAEIEKLKEEIQITKDAYTMLQTKNEIIKSEAIKEFAERLKEQSDSHFDYSELVFEIGEEKIDNLVKEMVGEYNI